MFQKRHEWIFFDVGSTLTDEGAQISLILETASEMLHIPRGDIYKTMIEASTADKNPVKEALRLLSGTDELYYCIKEEGKYYPPELERLFPRVKEMLEELSGSYKLGIIANQRQGLERRIKDFGVLRCFSIFAGSGDVGFSKPDPAIFNYALKKAGCAAERAVMVGDRPDNDIYPAKKLGFYTVWVKQGLGGFQKPISAEYEADSVIDRTCEITQLFY